MHDSAGLDETDLALVHALQLNPRVSWASLAAVLDVDASTLTRRWSRLEREGLAWFSCYPLGTKEWTGHHWEAGALVEVECVPGRRSAVMAELAGNAFVWNIDATSGSRDLMLTVLAASIVELDEQVLGAVAAIPGVRATRTHFFRSVIRDGSGWRLDALSPAQQQVVRTEGPVSPATRPAGRDLEVLRLLGPDARISAARVAAGLGCSPATAGRLIRRVVESRFAAVRCEVAHFVAGWQVAATLWLDVPQRDLQGVARAISRLPEIRLCATVGSEANLVAQVWLHRLEHLDRFEALLAARFVGTRVLDRWVTPQFGKRLGHLIGQDGRRTGYVPVIAESTLG
ncbi:Lrp/AsnC family transcriptional regulator [Saccharopolyspora sp. HNM0983]|uniref:Lrp/AsnC family transcriptional regulator n=1 Tax=Saccharopolyspora montiporae TaxID=2781240 RepID=A0A929B8N8_9PSEU|nr:Lrp/AsnC family transcriptional regulator [Saccharopolyspora sp. HNM0983]MBE9375274.1 Lrp/AsnC family transcriptional regulator [Saccharopolyspora sp. HNM0983]